MDARQTATQSAEYVVTLTPADIRAAQALVSMHGPDGVDPAVLAVSQAQPLRSQ